MDAILGKGRIEVVEMTKEEFFEKFPHLKGSQVRSDDGEGVLTACEIDEAPTNEATDALNKQNGRINKIIGDIECRES